MFYKHHSSFLWHICWNSLVLQACTEMVMPMCSNGIDDFFPPSVWNFTSYSEECHKRWKRLDKD